MTDPESKNLSEGKQSISADDFGPPRILVVGPGPRGRGGISSVIRLHQQTKAWTSFRCRLLHTFDDRSNFHKIRTALAAYLQVPFCLLRSDLVHIHLAAQTSMCRKLPIFFLSRMMRKPVIVHVHAPSEESLFRDTPSWLTHLLFRSSARVVALSQSWAKAFSVFEPRARVIVLANPVLNPEPVDCPGPLTPVVLAVGKLEARKGYADLLVAASEILKEFPDVQFWFAGQGELEGARMQADRLGIQHSVRLLGWVDGTNLEKLYRQATVLALPSYAEGMPMSVLEAMDHGVPVVCTPVGGLPELIRTGENGLFINPGDVRELARCIMQLLRDPVWAASLGAAGRLAVQQHCSLEETSRALSSLYTEVLAEGRRSR